jgi:hypothetical protein
VLLDHLSDRVLTVEDRTAIPFEFDSVTARRAGEGYALFT